MDINARKEQFSNAFLLATAAVAGCSVAKPSVDNDSIDWTLSNRLPRRPKLDVQLKCTSDNDDHEEFIPYSLKRKNYDDLIVTDLISPRALIVVSVPDKIEEWVSLTRTELILRRCARWLSLAGMEPTENATSITVYIPQWQRFTVESLNGIMETIDRGEPL